MPLVEEALAPYEVRPHWGKLFSVTPEQVQAAYPKMEDFKALLPVDRSRWQISQRISGPICLWIGL